VGFAAFWHRIRLHASLEVRRYKTLADYSSATGLDKHSVLLDFDTFVKVGIPDKSDPQRLYDRRISIFASSPARPR